MKDLYLYSLSPRTPCAKFLVEQVRPMSDVPDGQLPARLSSSSRLTAPSRAARTHGPADPRVVFSPPKGHPGSSPSTTTSSTSRCSPATYRAPLPDPADLSGDKRAKEGLVESALAPSPDPSWLAGSGETLYTNSSFTSPNESRRPQAQTGSDRARARARARAEPEPEPGRLSQSPSSAGRAASATQTDLTLALDPSPCSPSHADCHPHPCPRPGGTHGGRRGAEREAARAHSCRRRHLARERARRRLHGLDATMRGGRALHGLLTSPSSPDEPYSILRATHLLTVLGPTPRASRGQQATGS